MTSLLSFDPIYTVYFFVFVSAVLLVEGVYLLFFSSASYRKEINRRLQLLSGKADRESILVELRRERGLSSEGGFRLPLVALNRLITQSGLSLGVGKLALYVVGGTMLAFGAILILRGDLLEAVLAAIFCLAVAPYMTLFFLRSRRQKKFAAQFPDAIDIIVRSLRAGHPIPIAVSMVGREMPDPIGTEFGIVADEITYGAELEVAMRDLYYRCGQDDLPLFVTAVAIQGSTGGNLGEILENLSAVIRQRFKMRRKIKALAAEGKMSALILSLLPFVMFFAVIFMAPEFYRSVWHVPMTKISLACAFGWMLIGNFFMYRLVNFRI
jgi:tight adherence protein B